MKKRMNGCVFSSGMLYVVDKGSTNHVYVNGNMIASETEIPVEPGMQIRCADEDFVIQNAQRVKLSWKL